MALINFKKGLLASLPSTYAEGTFYVTTDERAIYLDVADDKRIRLGDFQEFANLAALEANANPSTSALYYITDGNILAKWDGAKYVQINVQKTVEKSATNGRIKFDGEDIVVYDDTTLANRVTTAEGKITALETASATHAVKADVDAALADKADKSYVGTFTHDTAKTVIEYINAKTDGIATSGNLEALGQRVGAIEGDYLKSTDKIELEDKIDLKADKSVVETMSTKLENISEGANKVEASETNGNIKINGVETVVYTHPEKHAIADITDLQDELDAKVNVADYNTDKATFALKTDVQAAIGSVHTHANKVELDKINDGDVAKWNAEVGAKALAEAAAVKTEVESALTGKVDKVEGKSLISDSEITRLASVNNYDDTQVKADIAKKADAETMTTELGKKVDKVEGYSLVADAEITRLAGVTNYNDTALAGRVATLEAIDHDKLAKDASAAAVATVLDGAPEKFDTLKEIAAWIADANTAEDAASLVTRVSTIEGDYLKSTDKESLESEINAKTTTAAVKDQIEAYGYATTGYADQAEADAKAYADAEVAKDRARLDTLEAIDHDVYVAADAALKTELQGEIDAKANSADVYAKTETFTKDEVNTAIATAVETALTWGAF